MLKVDWFPGRSSLPRLPIVSMCSSDQDDFMETLPSAISRCFFFIFCFYLLSFLELVSVLIRIRVGSELVLLVFREHDFAFFM